MLQRVNLEAISARSSKFQSGASASGRAEWRHARVFEMSSAMKSTLQLYGFGAFTAASAATGFAAFFAPVVIQVAAATALLGGVAGMVGWIAKEKRPHVPTLVFVSYGGTCRDPMAKVIMERLVAGRQPGIRILAAALKTPSGRGASKAARHIVHEETGFDQLCNHRPEMLSDAIMRDADLILTMNEEHAHEIQKAFPEHRSRVYNLLSFVGGEGDVADPWEAPDQMDNGTIQRYRACYRTLEDVLAKNVDKIYAAVTA